MDKDADHPCRWRREGLRLVAIMWWLEEASDDGVFTAPSGHS